MCVCVCVCVCVCARARACAGASVYLFDPVFKPLTQLTDIHNDFEHYGVVGHPKGVPFNFLWSFIRILQTVLILREFDTSSHLSSMGKKSQQCKLLFRIAMHWFRLEDSRNEIQILYSSLSSSVRTSCSL